MQNLTFENLKWHRPCGDLGLLPSKQRSLKSFLEVYIPFYIKNGIKLSPHQGEEVHLEGKDYRIPINLCFVYDDANRQIRHIILEPSGDQFIIGKGGERVVRKCYDLALGIFCAKKPVFPIEKEILIRFSGSVGATEVYGFCSENKKDYVIEKLYDFDLKLFLEKKLRPGIKLFLCYQLLKMISKLHSESIDACSDYVLSPYFPLPLYHGDIALKNILYSGGEKPKLALTDYGSIDKPTLIHGTGFYFSPECWDFRKSEAVNSDVMTLIFNRDNGQPSDMWAAGIVLASIVRGRLDECEGKYYPPLPSLIHTFQASLDPTQSESKIIPEQVHFNFDNIQADIQKMKEECKQEPSLANLCDLISRMLQRDPRARPKAEDALKFMDELITSSADPQSYFCRFAI